MDMQSMQSDPAQQGQESQSGYEICIKVDASGQISVGVEPSEHIDKMDQGDQSGNYRPVSSIRDALQVAGDIFRNAGQLPNGSSGDRAQMAKQVWST